MAEDNKDGSLAGVEFMYVGSVLPDQLEFHTSAFSRAGSMFQENLLSGMQRAGLKPSKILSVRQLESFPSLSPLWVKKECTELRNGMKVLLLPFLNISPIKQLLIGFFTLLYILKWGWITRHAQYRIVYTFNLTVPPGLFTFIGARLIGAKAFVSLNDINKPGQTVSNSFFNRLDYWLQRKLIPLFDGHIVVADAMMKDFAPQKKYVRVEGGVTPDLIQKTSAPVRNKRLKSARFKIVSVGSLNETNGFDVLLEAFSLLKGDNYQLTIAGSGPLEEDVRQAMISDSRVEYCGALSFDEVLALYNTADVLINMRITKEIDTEYFFPSKMMEYLVSGRPVITTSTGHVENEFSDFVFLIKDETPQSLAKLIKDVASLPAELLARKGEQARNYMIAHKTWDVQGRKVANYIRSMLSMLDH